MDVHLFRGSGSRLRSCGTRLEGKKSVSGLLRAVAWSGGGLAAGRTVNSSGGVLSEGVVVISFLRKAIRGQNGASRW